MSIEPSSVSGEDEPGETPVADEVISAPWVTRVPMVGGVGVLGGCWVVMTGLLILVGEGVKHSSVLMSMDRRLTANVVGYRTDALNQLMKALTWTGSWAATLGVAVLVAVFAWRRRLSGLAVIAVLLAWWGELLAVTVTKATVERPRPPEALWLVKAHGWSFPSGHTANAVVVFAAGATVVCTVVGGRVAQVVTWTLGASLTALVGFSRVELGVHWTTDVVASLFWTSCWLLIVVKVFRAMGRSPLPAGPSRQD